jgi:hypothetical protein
MVKESGVVTEMVVCEMEGHGGSFRSSNFSD